MVKKINKPIKKEIIVRRRGNTLEEQLKVWLPTQYINERVKGTQL